MARSNQHYVPKLLLKGFLSRLAEEAKKSQVRVLDLTDGSDRPMSIKNIMAEGRFNEFLLDQSTPATVEPASADIESHVAPTICRIRNEKRLERTPKEIGDLALLMAFQLIRTKKIRQMPESFNRQVLSHVERMGLDPSNVQGIIDFDKEGLKRQHILYQVRALQKYAAIIADKEFFLMKAPEGSSFYIGDHPVVFHNDEDHSGMGGNLGLAVPYIQIYLPLSAELLLCAYCPAVLGQLIKGHRAEIAEVKSLALRALMDGLISPARMRKMVEGAMELDDTTSLVERVRAGLPVEIGREQVKFYNSLQVIHANRFVIDPDGKFCVARQMISERTSLVSSDPNSAE